MKKSRMMLVIVGCIGLGLIVRNAMNPAGPWSPFLTYTGLMLLTAGIIGSFLRDHDDGSVGTWWGYRFSGQKPSFFPYDRAWMTTLVLALVFGYLGFQRIPLPGLPGPIVWPVLSVLASVLLVLTGCIGGYKYRDDME